MSDKSIPRKEELELVAEMLETSMEFGVRSYDMLNGLQLGLVQTCEQKELLSDARQHTLDARLNLTKARKSVGFLLKDATPANPKGIINLKGHPSNFEIAATEINGNLLVSIRPKDESKLIKGKNAVVHFVPSKDEPLIMSQLRERQDIESIIDFIEKIAVEPEITSLERDVIEYWSQHPPKK